MNAKVKANKFAIASTVFSLAAFICYGIVIILGTIYPAPEGHHSPLMGAAGPIVLAFAMLSLLMLPLGFIFGIVGLISIEKSHISQSGRYYAWIGIIGALAFIAVFGAL